MTELELADTAVSADRNLLAVWERRWTALDGTPGEIVWDADARDLEADLEHFAASFDKRPAVVDFGCGNGRQTRFLGRHFATVLGVDISPAAVDRARAAENPPNVSYRVLDARDPDAPARLHRELGDANVYIRLRLGVDIGNARRLEDAIADR